MLLIRAIRHWWTKVSPSLFDKFLDPIYLCQFRNSKHTSLKTFISHFTYKYWIDKISFIDQKHLRLIDGRDVICGYLLSYYDDMDSTFNRVVASSNNTFYWHETDDYALSINMYIVRYHFPTSVSFVLNRTDLQTTFVCIAYFC